MLHWTERLMTTKMFLGSRELNVYNKKSVMSLDPLELKRCQEALAMIAQNPKCSLHNVCGSQQSFIEYPFFYWVIVCRERFHHPGPQHESIICNQEVRDVMVITWKWLSLWYFKGTLINCCFRFDWLKTAQLSRLPQHPSR
jgi:hypothetical protein